MTRFDNFLAYAESNRLTVCGLAAVLIALIAWGDWLLPNISVGFLYLIPVLMAAPALKRGQIITLAVACGFLREAFDPLQGTAAPGVVVVPVVFNPFRWARGAPGRLLVVTTASAITGFS